MKYMEWESKFSMNDATIDKQHRKVIGFINKLDESLQPNEKDVLQGLVAILSNQASVIQRDVGLRNRAFQI